jgi:O-antigen/teichoic acid export membrane protein
VHWLSLAPLWLYARRRFPGREARVVGWGGIQAAAPFGLMALATLLYYRLGTLLLGALGSSSATARYTIASTIAFGLLSVPNAITTGLLPRLSAQEPGHERLRVAKRALRWTLLSCLVLSAVAAALAPWTLKYGFGSRYESALTPLVLLLTGTVVIGINGILGTVLITVRRTWVVGMQVGVSLAVNLALGFMLVPRFGANGAAVATLATELVGLGILAAAAHRLVPGLLQPGALAARAHREPRDQRRIAPVGDLRQESGL